MESVFGPYVVLRRRRHGVAIRFPPRVVDRLGPRYRSHRLACVVPEHAVRTMPRPDRVTRVALAFVRVGRGRPPEPLSDDNDHQDEQDEEDHPDGGAENDRQQNRDS